MLADGQQFVAFGVHPGTMRPYRWERDPELHLPHGLLPELDQATTERFVAVVADFIRDIGGQLIGTRWQPDPMQLRPRRPLQVVGSNAERLSDALERLGNHDLAYDDWIRVGLGIKADLGDDGFDLWCDWSSQSSKNNPKDLTAATRERQIALPFIRNAGLKREGLASLASLGEELPPDVSVMVTGSNEKKNRRDRDK